MFVLGEEAHQRPMNDWYLIYQNRSSNNYQPIRARLIRKVLQTSHSDVSGRRDTKNMGVSIHCCSDEHIISIFAFYLFPPTRMGLSELKPANIHQASSGNCHQGFQNLCKQNMWSLTMSSNALKRIALGSVLCLDYICLVCILHFTRVRTANRLPGTPLCSTTGKARCGSLSYSLRNDTLSRQSCLSWGRRWRTSV
jgi:hypothetical protein